MLLWLSTSVPPEELGHAVQSSGPLAQVPAATAEKKVRQHANKLL